MSDEAREEIAKTEELTLKIKLPKEDILKLYAKADHLCITINETVTLAIQILIEDS